MAGRPLEAVRLRGAAGQRGVDTDMELRDYVAALRRQWPTLMGVLLVGLTVAVGVVLFAPRTYQATAQVFVSSTAAGANSPQFVAQRVKGYPDVAVSAAVLGPAGEVLPGSPGVEQLHAHVTATNPADTSQINIVASSDDPDSAADIANAVADHFTDVVERLEKPADADSPVALTVTNPATAPSAPASPRQLYVLALGLLVGLFLGLAAAIVRSRTDPALHDADDVAAAWGIEDDLTVLTAPARRRRSRRSGTQPVTTLTRRLEALTEGGPGQVVVLSPAPGERGAAQALARELSAELAARQVASVRVVPADPQAPLRDWRALAAQSDRAVLVLPRGRVLAAELRETRALLQDVGLAVLAAVVVRTGSRGTGSDGEPSIRPPATPVAGDTRTTPAPRPPLAGTAPRR